jgi:hypothetical protein
VRALFQRSLAFAVVSLALALSDRVLAQAQAVEEPEEIIVRAKPLRQYRLEIERARDEMYKLFNEANEGNDNDVRCRYEAPTGSRIPERVCFSTTQDRASAEGARDFLNALFANAGKGEGGPQVNGGIGTSVAQSAAASSDKSALAQFEAEWTRLMGTNQQFYDAVFKYRELEDEFNRARGATIRMPIPVFALKGPQCEASTYTEYEQLGNVARVTGTVSISACPAGTTGKFALVARVRDEAGVSKPIEFSEAWENADAEDYIFYADYPIGDDVFLESVRVRNLTCSCQGVAQ